MIEVVRAEEHHVPEIGKLYWEFIRFHQDIDTWFTPLEDSIPGFQEYHLVLNYIIQRNVVSSSQDSQRSYSIQTGKDARYGCQ
jgi:hypothetical protein